jgi:DNA-binding winged helix-turn-helix (wHTH) protein
MEEKNFMLQQRFAVRPSLNSITDTVRGEETKLEPRLMKLLCLLAARSGQLHTREELVSAIWNDYGGGEAGLNHAVSSLRKLLGDTSKTLIETVPTKGYILHAEVSGLGETHRTVPAPAKRSLKRPALLLGILSILGLFFFLLPRGTDKEKGQAAGKALTMPFEAASREAEETGANTIVTIGKDSTVYKLKVVGDGRPQFYVNGRLLSPDEMEAHLDLIRNLKRELGNRELENRE